MDIWQMKYIVSIVENDFNITGAAQKLHISQPALSKSITAFESEINIQIFTRLKGRLTDLTPTGQIIYEKAKEVIQHYDELLEVFDFRSKSSIDTLLLGIPPLIITTFFSNFFGQLKFERPDIHINSIELGASKLEQLLEELKLDFAVLLKPTGINLENYNECLLHEGDVRIYMSDKHPLAKKDRLTWRDINNCDFALCDDSFRLHHLFLAKIKSENIIMNSLLTAYSWDYLFATIRDSQMITPLPYTSKYIFNMHGVKEVPMEDPIPWQIILAYRKKSTYTPIEKFTIEFSKKYFKSRANSKDLYNEENSLCNLKRLP
ncbi:MAG: LysR family regulatory protein [Lachnospiraceae bacterium]|jgi:DNA-binding transcriptional LysR family regulator|nr:LysR family regulatory protein [Lachnospiraceae bacterium]